MTDSENVQLDPRVLALRRDSPASDGELMRAAHKGSGPAAEALVERHWHAARRIAYAILDDAHAAEDVTQEAMLSLLGNLGRFDRRRAFEPWLHRIVTNRALDWLRSRERRAEVVPIVAPAPAPADSDPALTAALASLSPERRAVVVLRYVGGYGINEIARMLRLRRGTVGSRLRRGLDELRTHLEDQDG